jgi:D-mannonate dehydratase
MKIALQASESDEHIAFVRSLGLHDVVCGMPAEVDGVVSVAAIEQRRDRFSAHELDWGVIENLSPTLYDEIMFGAPERERQLDGVCRTIENIGKAGIPVLQYQWMLLGGLRTEYSPTGRGGGSLSSLRRNHRSTYASRLSRLAGARQAPISAHPRPASVGGTGVVQPGMVPEGGRPRRRVRRCSPGSSS